MKKWQPYRTLELAIIGTGGRYWDFALAFSECALQVAGLLFIGQNWLGTIGMKNYPELLIAFMSFFLMNLETSYDLHSEKSTIYDYHPFMKGFFWLAFIAMSISTLVAGTLAVVAGYQLKNLQPDYVRLVGLFVLGAATAVHLTYRLIMVIMSEIARSSLSKGLPDGGGIETARPMPGPEVV